MMTILKNRPTDLGWKRLERMSDRVETPPGDKNGIQKILFLLLLRILLISRDLVNPGADAIKYS